MRPKAPTLKGRDVQELIHLMDWNFEENQEIDEASVANVPEQYRSAYEAGDDGVYRVAEAYKPFVDAMSGLGKALKNERGVTKTLKGQKDAASQVKEALGFNSLEDAKSKFDEMAAAIASSSKVDPEKLKADLQKTFDAQAADKDKQLDTMRGTLNRYMVESSAVAALAEAKGNSKLLLPLIREQVELVQDEDEYVVRVKDADGDYRGNGQGGFMSVADLVAEMSKSKDYAGAFESENRGGTGDPVPNRPGRRQTSQMRNQQQEPASANDRIKQGLANRRKR